MTTEDKGSVSIWVGSLKAGDQAAAQKLWDRYFDKLVHVARAKLRATRRPGIVEDEEDAALSAFDSLCAGAALGRFPQLADRDDLWKLLVVITARKAVDQMQREGRQKRGGGRVVGESALAGPLADEGLGGLDQMVGSEPSPEFAAMVADEHRRLLNLLGDETLRRIAIWKMEGYTNEEIRQKLGCALRTVANKLELIRRTWLNE
ncbi:ECF-type sigma factor [Singulisphaera acidiphila]|uniref:DNA-directed RNA polymerase specialized sigma subunit, sigma24 n=1 Tax=Singulisphaera acidiphila (strain ATCC BAA-1392 / DSM 18658 / VKM B-2454 / MOB10) TaxID=886293 RepID=L0DJN8_SINAD|nr:ECF-type sigma factor [Singulisphaera acidiphila]AGA29060.1 DNA-directed RNA polymerase specialized sigma subunit, sigma24 [Singulisphaera acidiphila DSM 18658]